MISKTIQVDKDGYTPCRTYRLVPCVPTHEMIDFAAEMLYSHTREQAIEMAKEDKFDSYAHNCENVYERMIASSPAPDFDLIS